MGSLSRGFIVNRAYVADRWLQNHYGINVIEADDLQLLEFLESTPADQRRQTLDALVAYGDDAVRRGMAPKNAARTIRLP